MQIGKHSIVWQRGENERVELARGQYDVVEGGRRVLFRCQETAYIDFVTGKAGKRTIEVSLVPDGDQLQLTISPTQTPVAGYGGLAVKSPERTCVFQRK